MRFVRVSTSLWTAILVPVYWAHHGPLHFLWLSDIALFLTLAAVWLSSVRLFSITLLFALPFEIAWNLDFFIQLVTGANLMGIADYMFEDDGPAYLRVISLFHVFLLAVWIWLLWRFGYHRRSLVPASILWTATVVLSYAATDPERNINWVHSVRTLGIEWAPPWAWPLAMVVLVPAVVYPLTHRLLARYAKEAVPMRGTRSAVP